MAQQIRAFRNPQAGQYAEEQMQYYFELFGQIQLPEATQINPKQIAS